MGFASYFEDISARFLDAIRQAERAVVLGTGHHDSAARLRELMAEVQPCLDQAMDLATRPDGQASMAVRIVDLERQVVRLRHDLEKAEVLNGYWRREGGPLQEARDEWEKKAKEWLQLYFQAREQLRKHEPNWEPRNGPPPG